MMNKIYDKHFVNIPIRYSCLLPLILLTCFISGCSKNQSDSIQTAVSREHSPLVAPITNKVNQQTNEKYHKIKSARNFYKNPVLIKIRESQLEIKPSLTGNTLQLGNSRIEHWPLGLPDCKVCRLEVNMKFYPDGPDTLITLHNDDKNYQWGVVQSSQKNVKLLLSELSFNEQNELIMNHKNKKTLLLSGQTYHTKSCTLTPLWIETIPQLSAVYSDDQAKHKIQILFECK